MGLVLGTLDVKSWWALHEDLCGRKLDIWDQLVRYVHRIRDEKSELCIMR